ncbi:Isochorismatase hydrolase [Leucogyrophana mollusca]|uniref:Isochorismatase hydrolase n=1 Tax=Leucogyrophana mollusca TaxID=85980 RepID=A0ACB8BX82_9AGAM|nr:Isochorismatase hydrolase [Leucogyrophana mollusca]
MAPIAKLHPKHTVFFLCDLQTRFKTAIYGYDELVLTANKMLKIAKVLEIAVVVTEQNPKGKDGGPQASDRNFHYCTGLGNTDPDIDLASLGALHIATIDKTLFSMVTPEVTALLGARTDINSVVLFGIESHVCVLQSALDLLELGYDVHILADGVSSCNKEEVPYALARIRQAGGYITTSESASFQLQRDSGTPRFKAFSNIVKEDKDSTKRVLQTLLQYRSSL